MYSMDGERIVRFLDSTFASATLEFHSPIMITDVQLAIVANILNVLVFLLIILYHYINSSNMKAKRQS